MGRVSFVSAGIHYSVTGTLFAPVEGEDYKVCGKWDEHPKYGRQIKASSIDPVGSAGPTTERGIYALLCSKDVAGIGPVTARAIVDHFGAKTLDIIRSDTEYKRLTEVPGVGNTMACKLHASFPSKNIKEDVRMLVGTEMTDKLIERIITKYGTKAPFIIRDDPYRLIEDFPGIGFLKADKIAEAVGIADDAPQRIKAAVYHILNTESELNGHCFSYCSNLELRVQELIPGVSVDAIADAIKEMSTDKSLFKTGVCVDKDGAVYLSPLYLAETGCAKYICDALASPSTELYTSGIIVSASDAIQKKTGITPEESQLAAVQTALNSKICVITGGPGTGKTTIIRTMLEAIELCEPEKKVALMAPTGRAAVRMQDVTGHEARTIPRRLMLSAEEDEKKARRRFTTPSKSGRTSATEDAEKPIQEDYVIVDEASMIDIKLAYYLVSSIKKDAKVIFVGDVDQLPPVGPGTFFRDLISSFRVPTVRLKFSFRQSGYIASNANKVNYGEGVHGYAQDDTFRVVPANKATGPEKAIKEYMEMVEKYGPKDVILLSPTKKRGAGCTNTLNKAIQEVCNPKSSKKSDMAGPGYIFREGDRVMLDRNLWKLGLANGDTGHISKIIFSLVTVRFDNGRSESFTFQDFRRNFLLAYACTVHKSQGSEYKGVVFLFTNEHAFMGERNIIYTAVTRAKDRLRIVGDARAINRAIDTVKPLVRNSKLKERINNA